MYLAAMSLAPLRAATAQQLTAPERAHALATIWAEARYNFAYWDRVRVDWDSALRVNLKLAAEPQSDLVFYRRLRRFVALLGDGQAAVLAPPNLRSRIARPPLLLTGAARRPFIMDYAENDEMRVAHPDRLAQIVAVQGVPAEARRRGSLCTAAAPAAATRIAHTRSSSIVTPRHSPRSGGEGRNTVRRSAPGICQTPP